MKANHTNTSGKAAGSGLMKFFEDSLKDIYWAEKALVTSLEKMANKATSGDLTAALDKHLAETEEQVRQVEKVFELIGRKPEAVKCEAMNGLIMEAEEIMKETEEGAMRDAAIIAAAQKAEHYEIATYGTLCTYAETLGLKDAKTILGDILEQEMSTDAILTDIAVTTINLKAAEI